METDLTSALVAARAAGTRQSLDVAMLKKAQEADQATIAMRQAGADAAKTLAPAPAGQGLAVDKLA
jgi:hypothetical protein